MVKRKPVSIKALFIFLASVTGGLMLLIILFFALLSHTNKSLSQAHLQRYMSYQLADELRQSSDDLTRLARTYVVTGDERYARQYQSIVDIRAGKQNRPQEYSRIYWDLFTGNQPPRPDTNEKVALTELMRKNGFSDAEMAKLNLAQANSENLVKTESLAMESVKGNVDVDSIDRRTAIEMLHSSKYHADKAVIMQPINEFFELLDARTKEQVDLMQSKANKEIIAIYSLLFVSLIILLLLLVIAYRRLLSQLGCEPYQAQQLLELVAAGDLTPGTLVKPANTNSVIDSTLGMQENLRSIMQNLQQNANSLLFAAQDLSDKSQDVSASSSSQSEATITVAAAVEEMLASINQIAENTRDAQNLTMEATQISQDGERIISEDIAEMERVSASVNQASKAVNEMNERSQQISGIVSVIKEVAEQTNLLALNAAIEAARAGEDGRGFAVVADEVRRLAERTANATTEISQMIVSVQECAGLAVNNMEQTVNRVTSSTTLIHKVDDSIKNINGAIMKVSQLVVGISNALREQSTANNEIARNIEHISMLSEKNSSTINSYTDTANTLADLATKTNDIVLKFRLT